MLVVNFNSCMMNEKFWEDPHIYRPERFLKNGVLEVPEFYIPFGLGKQVSLFSLLYVTHSLFSLLIIILFPGVTQTAVISPTGQL